ncbi:MAG: UDP-N-acetylglucosamine 1-carboxyvinyltransferase [Candidatus Magasanikbacteria bacterium]|nr:UDP-N-acetylglucosamine 1-carboxyvinyltransferase [Candidatus Magasanikbacteria bacterium]
MATFVIEGGKQVKGSIKVNTAKNSAVAILCASTMIKGKLILHDMPKIEEVNRILEILSSIGVKYDWLDDHSLEIDSSAKLKLEKIDKDACMKVRSSLMFFGALSARVKKYKLYRSGGCKLGLRTIRPHLFALEKMGINIESKDDHYLVENGKIRGTEVVMYESGDTPSENTIMAAAMAKGKTTIKFASANYMVQDLCYFLNKAGAKIKGIGTNTLEIEGVENLNPIEYSIMPDPLEAMAFIALAITTNSKLLIENCPLDFLELELEKLRVMGQEFKLKNKRLSKNKKFNIVDIEILPSKLTALPDKIHGMPFPGINIDNVPFFVPIATQAEGRTLIHDWVFENRTIYFLEFSKLGANVTLLDPHRVFVEGKTDLKARELIAPDGIRPAMALLIGMIAAKGKSIMRNIYVIERGYEDLAGRLQTIGVNIKRIDD